MKVTIKSRHPNIPDKVVNMRSDTFYSFKKRSLIDKIERPTADSRVVYLNYFDDIHKAYPEDVVTPLEYTPEERYKMIEDERNRVYSFRNEKPTIIA